MGIEKIRSWILKEGNLASIPGHTKYARNEDPFVALFFCP